MPITPYSRPQDTITQILRNPTAATAARRNALVIGPQYLLALNDGREISKHAFDNAGATLPYEVVVDGVTSALNLDAYTPSLPEVKLYGFDLLAEVSDTIGDFAYYGTGGKSLRLTSGLIGGGALIGGLSGRPVKVGDTIEVTVTRGGPTVIGHYTRKVASLLYKLTAPSYSTSGASFVLGVTGTYTGTIARTLIVEAVTATTVNVYDSAGILPTVSGSVDATVVAAGLSIAIDDVTLTPGDKAYVAVTPTVASSTEIDGFTLDGTAKPADYDSDTDAVAVIVLQSFTGEITSDNYEGGVPYVVNENAANGVDYESVLGLNSALSGSSSFAPFRDAVGKMALSYKAVVIPASTEGAVAISSASSIVTALGEIDDENWLARGTFEAINGAQGATVYALRTAGDTVEAFSAALNKIRSTDIYYALVPLTDSLDVAVLVKDHCEEMSNKYNMNFRRCYVGTDSPGEYAKWDTLSTGGLVQASLDDAGVVTLIEDFQGAYSFTADAAVGDYIEMIGVSERMPITAIISNSEVEVTLPVGATALAVAGFRLIRKDSAANIVKYVTERSAALGSRRCVNVWSDMPTRSTSSGSEVVPMKFVAAEVAGLRCALLPQQGLTMTELSSVTAASAMYTKFTPDQLDAIASYGTFIVTQEIESGPVFIRHQLTTDTADGALAYEDSVGVIVDTFSQQVKDTFRSYRGRRNVTRETIEDIRVRLKQLALDASQAELANAVYGPMIIRFFDADGKESEVTVKVDGALADHIATYVKLRVPLPLNGINHYIDVETSVDL